MNFDKNTTLMDFALFLNDGTPEEILGKKQKFGAKEHLDLVFGLAKKDLLRFHEAQIANIRERTDIACNNMWVDMGQRVPEAPKLSADALGKARQPITLGHHHTYWLYHDTATEEIKQTIEIFSNFVAGLPSATPVNGEVEALQHLSDRMTKKTDLLFDLAGKLTTLSSYSNNPDFFAEKNNDGTGDLRQKFEWIAKMTYGAYNAPLDTDFDKIPESLSGLTTYFEAERIKRQADFTKNTGMTI